MRCVHSIQFNLARVIRPLSLVRRFCVRLWVLGLNGVSFLRCLPRSLVHRSAQPPVTKTACTTISRAASSSAAHPGPSLAVLASRRRSSRTLLTFLPLFAQTFLGAVTRPH